MATDTTDNSFDASAGIITIDWKLNTSDDKDSSDNDVTQRADNDESSNRLFVKMSRIQTWHVEHKPEEQRYKS